MITRLRNILATAVVTVGLAVTATLAATPSAQAVDIYQACGTGASSNVCASKNESVQPFIKRLVNTLLYIIAALAVIMLIIGGIRYTASAGNASQTTAAKNTILYAVIGLLVAVFAYAIVNFVIIRIGRV